MAAALSVARTGNEVTLFSDESFLPYFRPKMPAVAFGQDVADNAIMHPESWYKNNKINLILDSKIAKVTSNYKVITVHGKEYCFDKVIVTAGAIPAIPSFAENCAWESVVPLWGIEHAKHIREKIKGIKKVVIIGGGVIGIEAALRAVDTGLDVTIIEYLDSLMQRNLSNKASELLAQTLKAKGIKLYMGHAVEHIDDSSDQISIRTNKEEDIKADLVILSIGNSFDLGFVRDSGLKMDRGIITDEYMQTSDKNFFAGGDISQLPGAINVCSAVKAIKQGKIAGINSVSDGEERVEFRNDAIGVLLKYKDFQLSAIGEIPDDMSHLEEVLEHEPGRVYRALVRENGKLVGIQMIGSIADYKKYERELLTEQ